MKSDFICKLYGWRYSTMKNLQCSVPGCQLRTEAATRVVLWEKIFLENSQNPQENICARVSVCYSLASHPGIFQTNVLLFYTRDLCELSQPLCLISSTTFDKKLDFTTANHKRIYKFNKDLIPLWLGTLT